ncbi:MAG: cytidylate kinase-like family protein [Desulfobacteraceae bacterium]|nr:cytidylate kinase-like family protein [Desulfobacteraceae bacterium]MBU4053550.1 cytidylate kinase-like family protein [Pseudomonadota bacterium]
MSIVTISRGSYSRGREVAEKLAALLNYECLSREIILEASEQFNIPEIKLVRAIHDAPSILDRFTYGKERYIAFFRAALLKRLQKDSLIYHGLAGHAFLQKIPHVLKVRIMANLEDRIKEEMKRERISADQARHILVKDDAERRKWSMTLYGLDTWDQRFYDMTLHLDTMDVDDAVSIILCSLNSPCFQTTPESTERLEDLCLSAQVEAALVRDFPKVTADARNGVVYVSVRGSLVDEKGISRKVKRMVEKVDEVKKVHVNIVAHSIQD